MAKSSRRSLKHTANSSLRQTNINDLPDELLEEIFCRLECPSTVRCKSVTKRWCALISRPDFVRSLIRHHHHRFSPMQKQPNSQVLFLSAKSQLNPESPTSEAEAITRRFLLRLLKHHYRLLGESNGWFCCDKRLDKTSNIYYICNPVTNYWLELPPAPSSRPTWSWDFGFLCDPYYHIDDETHIVTLNAECRFAVVRFVRFSKSPIVEVFSSCTGRWSNLSLSRFPIQFRITSWSAVAFDGKFHFLGQDRILTFDPFKNSETCITSQCNFIDFPKDCMSPRELLVTPSGSLGIIHLKGADIWELKGEKWCLQEKKNVEEIAQNFKEAYIFLPTIDSFTLFSSIATVYTKFVICYKDYKIACYRRHDRPLNTRRCGKPYKSFIRINLFPTVLPWWQGPPLKLSQKPL